MRREGRAVEDGGGDKGAVGDGCAYPVTGAIPRTVRAINRAPPVVDSVDDGTRDSIDGIAIIASVASDTALADGDGLAGVGLGDAATDTRCIREDTAVAHRQRTGDERNATTRVLVGLIVVDASLVENGHSAVQCQQTTAIAVGIVVA